MKNTVQYILCHFFSHNQIPCRNGHLKELILANGSCFDLGFS